MKIHYVHPSPEGRILSKATNAVASAEKESDKRSSVTRIAIACDPSKGQPTKDEYGITSELDAVTCDKCKATDAYKKRQEETRVVEDF